MKNCYEILGVGPDATAAEIRRAYRRKAKLLHPDITGKDSDAFRELREAYELLSDAQSRALFDEKNIFTIFRPRQRAGHQSFNYHEWLLERDDDESRTKLIFFDLIHHNEDEAVRVFKSMTMKNMNFRLSRWVTREDFMDLGFILCEELVLRREYYDAVLLLEQLIHMEATYPYYNMFFPEVLSLARYVLRNNIEGSVCDELAIDAWERALDMHLGADDDVFFLLKISDCYRRMGDEGESKRYLEKAKHIKLQSA